MQKSLLSNKWGRWLGDWTIAATIFARSGLPFTVVDTGTGGILAGYGYGGANLFGGIFANQTGSLGAPIPAVPNSRTSHKTVRALS